MYLFLLADGHSAAVGGGIAEGMDRLRQTIDLNVTAACLVIREAIQMMTNDTTTGGGHILLINR